MDTKAAIKKLKERIKDLAAKQRPLKRARKTTIPEEERCALLCTAGVDKGTSCETHEVAAYKVRERKSVITAALNLYHELRGSDYRHCKVEELGLYERYVNGLKEELKLTA